MAKNYPKLSGTLKKLLFDNDMKPSDLAREVNLPVPTVHRLVTGKSTRPYKSSLKPIADYFAINVDELLGVETLSSPSSSQPPLNPVQYIPLIEWNTLIGMHVVKSSSHQQLPFIGRISKNGFATTLQDSSMEPIFSKGSILIFDPDHSPIDRSYVLVRLSGSNTHLFRQLITDADHHYLKPLNPDLNQFNMRLLNKKDQILGVLLESRNQY